MAKNITYQINYQVNQAGLAALKQDLANIKQDAENARLSGNLTNELKEADRAAKELEKALEKAFNVKLNRLNLHTFNQEIAKSFGSVDQLKIKLEQVGKAQTFNSLSLQAQSVNQQLKTSDKLLNDMAVTFKNTIRYGISSSIFNGLANGIQKAFEYTKSLDTSLNDIRIVSDKSASDMERFAVQANKAAKALGSTTRDYTNASLIYYQQGLNDEETAARAETTLKTANVTAQSGQEVSEQLTAIWNGYRVQAEETELYIDKVAKVAATSAADLEELATGMSKVASAANSAGVDIDQLNATLATVISVTREAPETIGSAFKTIYARLGDLALDGEDEYGVSLGKVSGQLHDLGIEILTDNGEMREMGDIVEDIAAKWETWTRAQRQAAAVAMAGKMQYSRLIALFDNWDMYTKYLNDSTNALGTLNQQQDIYMESTEAHLKGLQTEWERLYDTVLDQNAINSSIDSMSGLMHVINNLMAGLGGGLNDIAAIGLVVSNIFRKQIAESINTVISNMNKVKQNKLEQNAQQQWTQAGFSQVDSAREQAAYDKFTQDTSKLQSAVAGLTQERYNELNTLKLEVAENELLIAKIMDQGDKQGANAAVLQQQAAIQKKIADEEIKNYAKIESYIETITKANKNNEKSAEQAFDAELKLIQLIEDYQDKGKGMWEGQDLLTQQEQIALQTALNKLKNDEELTQMDISTIERAQTVAMEQNTIHARDLTEQARLQQMYEDGTLERLQRENTLRRSNFDTGADEGIRQAAIQTTIQNLSTLSMSLITVSGLFKTALNPDLSGLEKFEQITTTLLFMLPMLLSSVGSLKGGLAQLAIALGATGTAEEIASQGALKATISIGALKVTLGEFFLIIGAVVAVVGLLAIGIKALIDAYNADARAAQQAAEAAAELEENYSSLAKKAKELKDAITGYEDAKKDLKDLKAGTEEYAEALDDANAKAKELIESLKLYNDYTVKNGVIEIDPDALKTAQLESKQRLAAAEQEMNFARLRSNQANLKSNRTDYSREVGAISERTEMINGDYYNRIITLSDEALSTIVDKISESAEATTALETGDKDTIRNFINDIDGLSDDTKKLTDKIVEEDDGLKQLVKSTREAAEANEYYIRQMNLAAINEQFDSALTQMANTSKTPEARREQVKEIINNSEPQQRVRAQKETSDKKIATIDQDYLSREFLDFNKNKYINEVINDVWGIGTSVIGGNINSDEDLARKYAKYVKNMADKEVDNLVWKSGKLLDSSGSTVLDASNSEQRGKMRYGLLSTVIKNYNDDVIESNNQQSTLDFAANLNQAIVNAQTLGAQYGVDFSDALLNAIEDKTHQFDLTSLFVRLNPNQVGELSSLNTEQLSKMFGMTEQNIKDLGFESAQQFADNFKSALEGYEWDIDDAIAASMDKKSSKLDEAGEGLSKKKLEQYKQDVEIYAKNLMQIADSSDEVADGLKYDSDLAVDFALRVIKMNKAIDTLADNFEDWNSIIRKSSQTSQEYAEAMYYMRDAIADVYDTSMDYVSNDFIKEHLEEIEKIAKGDEAAIEGLRAALAQEIVANITLENDISNREEILANFQNLRAQIEGQLSNLQIGSPVIDDGDLVNSLNKMIEDCQMTVEQANAVFSAMGVEPTYETETVTQEQSNPIIQTDTQTTETEPREMEYIGPDGEKHIAKVPNFTQIQTSRTIGYSKDNVEVPVTAIAVNGKQPKISGIKKAPGGSMNNYSSQNKGGKTPGSKSSGGKGGGSKAKEPAEEKKVESKKDPYHDIDIIIKDISHDLDKLQKQQSKFFGQRLIDNLNKQYELLNRQIDATTQKLGIARQEQARLASELSDKGISFNADGTIANYAQAYDAQLGYVNGVIDQYNAMSAEGQEGFKKTLEKAKEDFDKFKEAISEYDKTVTDIIPELESNIQDAVDKQIEIKIEEFTMEIKIRLDMSEAERDWNEFERKVIKGIKDTDILGNARARLKDFNSYYNSESTGEVQSLMKQVANTQAQLEQMDRTGWSDFYGDNRAQGLEDLKSYNDQLMKSMEDVEDLIEEIKKSYLDMIDEAADKFQDQVDMYEQVKDIIDHDMNIIQLVYGEDSYADLEKYYQMQEDNNNKQLDFLRQQKDFWYAQMQTLEQGSEEWEKAKENWMDAVSEWNSKVEEAVENIQDKYLNTINKIFDELNNKVTNGAGLNYVSEEWELINQNADQYLDTINSLYGIQSLENKYLDAIDQTDNLSAQRKLNNLMNEELDALREKDKLTQYDIDRANMKYEIALKQIALEEAQQNKSTMRLRRDSQGNYTYQYVADNDQIGQLQDELTTLKNELYNFDLEHYRDNLDQVLEIYQEFQEKMKEAAQINDPEERAAMELLLQEQYGELINGLVEQNETIRLNLHESAFTELADLYNTDLNNFQSLTSEEQEVLLGQMIPQWDSGIQHMSDTFAGEGGFIPTCKDAMEQLNAATEIYEQDLNQVQQAAGQDFGDVQRGIDETKTKTEELIQDNGILIQTYQDQLNAIQNVINELQSLCSQYNAVKIAAQQAAEAAYNYWRAVNGEAANAAGNNVSGGSGNSGSSSSNSRGSNNSSSGGAGSVGGDGATVGNQITYSGSYYYDSFGTKPSGSKYSGVADGVTIDIVNNNPYGIHIKSSDGRYPDLGWIKHNQVTRWNTGGYTGDWGDDSGRLAILDRKELILNKDDTANMLNILQLTRDFMNSMNNVLLSRMINSVNGAPNTGMGMVNEDTLEQNVHIDATFPNVKDAREVEEALNNLVNVASQRIGRNTKR